MSREFNKEQVIGAIEGSGGITSTIAKRLGCAWYTAKRYINLWACTRRAFENEQQTFLDACESVLERNVQLAMEQQRTGQIADTSDVKWVLARLAKNRGYSERQEITGPEGGPIETRITEVIVQMPNESVETD